MSMMDWETLKRLIAASERLSIGSYFLDVSGDCLDPGRRTVSGRPPKSYGAWMSNSGTTVSLLRGWGTWAEPMFDLPMPITLSISARCRKCATCLASRRRLWQARVAAEVRYSERSWFGTLTHDILHGDQFVNFDTSAATDVPLASVLNSATGAWKYAAEADIDALFVDVTAGPTGRRYIRADGVHRLVIAGAQRDHTPGTMRPIV